ncbi:uncharacterized protein Dvir_GJ17875, isoform B [Drosophila virilis]|uniref:Uncharacterized protein, isoform B n=1 Tax=Drosophila virilis TaxID=7244 RepID=A0A0Q9VYW4_DROVI|nr:uncharacterized protein Dvir_GJ17875, isoform B [Drosophila virilis]
MLAPIKHLLSNYRIVLASGSPRRQELVQMLGLNAELCPSTFEENLDVADFKEFSDYIEATALGKAEEVFQRLSGVDDSKKLLVIAADTMVTLGKEIYGKPKDAADAVRMLTNLSGACNRVFTGVVFKHALGVRKFTETADVYFGQLTEAQIQSYVDSGDPLPTLCIACLVEQGIWKLISLPLQRQSRRLWRSGSWRRSDTPH